MATSGTVLLLTLTCVSGVWFSRISGAEVEMRVRPGDDVIFYSDCVWEVGFYPVWFRNSSCECQPPLIISTEDLVGGAHPRYSIVSSLTNKTHDLLVKNVSESDLGLYYCALHEKKVFDQKYIHQQDVYHYGSTRLSLLVPSFNPTQITSTPVSDCSVCWKLLVSVCPVCVLLSSLLSSTCVYFICRSRIKGSGERGELITENVYQVGRAEEHQCKRSMKGKFCFHTEVSYTPLNSDLKSD